MGVVKTQCLLITKVRQLASGLLAVGILPAHSAETFFILAFPLVSLTPISLARNTMDFLYDANALSLRILGCLPLEGRDTLCDFSAVGSVVHEQ